MNEHQAEDKFCQDVRAAGGLAIKLRSRFQAGLLDLFVKMPGLPGVFIESKFQRWPKASDFSVDLTSLQSEAIKRLHSVGQPAGWMLYTEEPRKAHNRTLLVVASRDHMPGPIGRAYMDTASARRPSGMVFDVHRILERIIK